MLLDRSRATIDAQAFFAARHQTYARFIRSVGYVQGIRAYFLRSPLLRDGLRVLDAGCGTGAASLAFREAVVRRRLEPGPAHAFDLTPAMLQRFRDSMTERGVDGFELAQANVLELERLPSTWTGYDLIVSASMLEYLPPARVSEAISALRSRLKPGGAFVLFITRRNWLTRPLIGRWWESNVYTAGEVVQFVRAAGFAAVRLGAFPPLFRYLALWGHVIEATGPAEA